MSKTNKIVVIIAVILIIILGAIAINRNNESNTNADTQSQSQIGTTNQIATKKTNGIYEIYNTDIKTNTGSTIITATIKNISKNKTERQMVEVVLLDKNSKEIGRLIAIIPSLGIGESTEIYSEDLKVYENIYDFRLK